MQNGLGQTRTRSNSSFSLAQPKEQRVYGKSKELRRINCENNMPAPVNASRAAKLAQIYRAKHLADMAPAPPSTSIRNILRLDRGVTVEQAPNDAAISDVRSEVIYRKELSFAEATKAQPGDTYHGMVFTTEFGWMNPDVVIEGYQNRLSFLLYALDMFKIASYVYGDNEDLLPSYIRPVLADALVDLDLDPQDFENSGIGFQASLYFDEKRGAYVLAFRGSETNWDIYDDWIIADFRNSVGALTDQYEHAASLARKVDEAVAKSGGNLFFTGHSLGGGLAELAAITTNRPATTFNAAGANNATLYKYAEKMSLWSAVSHPFKSEGQQFENINSIYVNGEIVSFLQDMIPFVASAKGKRIPLFSSGGNIGTNHTRSNIKYALHEAILGEVAPVANSESEEIIVPMQDATYVQRPFVRDLGSNQKNFISNTQMHTEPNQQPFINAAAPTYASANASSAQNSKIDNFGLKGKQPLNKAQLPIQDKTFVNPVKAKQFGPAWLNLDFNGQSISVPNPQQLTKFEYGKFLNSLNFRSIASQGQLFGPNDEGWSTTGMSEGTIAGRQARLDYEKYVKLYGPSKLMKLAFFMQHVGWPMLSNFEGTVAEPAKIPQHRNSPNTEGNH